MIRGVQYPPPLPTTEFEMQGILEKLVEGGGKSTTRVVKLNDFFVVALFTLAPCTHALSLDTSVIIKSKDIFLG